MREIASVPPGAWRPTLGVLPAGSGVAVRGGEPFVGRDPELTLLRDLLAGASRGHGAVVLVTGDAGIGKTRLAHELRDAHRAAGGETFVGACWDDRGAPPYWPWTEILDAMIHARGSAVLDDLAPVERAALPVIVPSIRTAGDPSPVADGEHGRSILYAAVGALLREASASAPVLVVIEDVHAADLPTLRLLRAVAPRVEQLPVLLLATVRTGEEPPADVAAALDDLERVAVLVALDGLDEVDVRAYLSARLEYQPEEDLVRRVRDVTDGNPLFVGEVARLVERGEEAAIPARVRDAVRRRIASVSPAAREALEVAAVLGRDLDVVTVQRALGTEADTAADLLAEAAQHGIITPAELRGFRFSHGLFRDALYLDLGPRRLALHARVAGALEGLVDAGYADVADAARHYAASLPVGDAQRARDLAVRAAQRATGDARHEEAAELYAHAVTAHELLTGDPSTRARLLSDLASARFRAGERDAARAAWRESARTAREARDVEAFAEAALGFATEVHWGAPNQERIELLSEALAALPDDDSPLRVRLLARLAEELYWTPDRDRRRALSDEALDRARRVGDDRTLAAALRGRLWAVRDPDSFDERARNSDELVRIGRATRDRDVEQEGRYHLVLALLEGGDLPAVDREVERHVRLADERRHPVELWRSSMWRAMRALTTGPMDEATASVAHALELGNEVGDPNAVLSYWAQRTELGRWRGWEPDVFATLSSLAGRFGGLPVLRCAQALVASEVDPPFSLSLLDELVASHALPFDSTWLGSTFMLAEAATATGSAEHASTLLERLVPYADRCAFGGPGAVAFGPVSYALAGCCTVLGRSEEAIGYVDRALTAARATGAGVWAVAAETRRSHALGEPVGADVVAAAARLGMTRWAGSPPVADRTLRAPGGDLTPRELEVLGLLGRGMSNRRIAETLFVTEKTVKTHVSSVLAKLHVTDRTQAALVAVRMSLVGDDPRDPR